MPELAAKVNRAVPGMRSAFTTSWQLGADMIGQVDDIHNAHNKSVQIDGDFTTARLIIEGSIDGQSFYTLNDNTGVSLFRRAGTLKAIAEPVVFIRPRVVGGDSGTDIKVTLLALT